MDWNDKDLGRCVWLRPNIFSGKYSANAQTGQIAKAYKSDYDQTLSGTGVMIQGHFDLLKPL